MYLIVNSNLMYHASIPMTDEGEFKQSSWTENPMPDGACWTNWTA